MNVINRHLYENYGQIWLFQICSGQLKLQLTHLTGGSLNMTFSINMSISSMKRKRLYNLC